MIVLVSLNFCQSDRFNIVILICISLIISEVENLHMFEGYLHFSFCELVVRVFFLLFPSFSFEFLVIFFLNF